MKQRSRRFETPRTSRIEADWSLRSRDSSTIPICSCSILQNRNNENHTQTKPPRRRVGGRVIRTTEEKEQAMKSRLLSYGLSLLMAGAVFFTAMAPAQAADKKPNILVIWGDDIGTWNISHNSRGMMGYKTPNIDRIA